MIHRPPNPLSRRFFLRDCGVGLGKMALAGLLTDAFTRPSSAAAAPVPADPLALRKPHFAAKAKRVIHLFMAGAPSQLELFDYKPELARFEGKPLLLLSIIGDQRYAFIRLTPHAGAALQIRQQPRAVRCGEISEALPHFTKVADDISLIKAVHTDQFNHAPAQIFFTGFSQLSA
ncbi:MAG: DUF1501 domain-containing protein [Verrucomicrobiales bacterium]